MAKALLVFYNYLYPFVAYPLLVWGWWAYTQNWTFVTLVMGLPTVFGYIAPGIATNVLGKWEFRGPLVVGKFYAHHGITYAAWMSLALFVSFGGRSEFTTYGYASIVLVSTCSTAFVAWWHDLYAVKLGRIISTHPLTQLNVSAEELTAAYAPLSFSSIGFAYALTGVVGHFVIIQGGNKGSIWWLFLAGFAALTVAGWIAYGLSERWGEETVREAMDAQS